MNGGGIDLNNVSDAGILLAGGVIVIVALIIGGIVAGGAYSAVDNDVTVTTDASTSQNGITLNYNIQYNLTNTPVKSITLIEANS